MTRPARNEDTPADSADAGEPRRRRWVRPVIFLAVLIVLFVVARALGLDEYLRETRSVIERMGPLGPLVFILIYIVATVAMVPAWPLTVLAGALFHWIAGTIYVSIGATVGAAICFLIARYAARDVVAAWVADRPTFKKLNDLTDQHGVWIVAITRLVPIFPYNLLNYAFGITAVGFWTYTFWSWLCMLPGTMMYVIGSGAITRLLESDQVPWQMLGLLAGLIAVMTLITWYGRKQWKAAVARKRARADRLDPPGEDPSPEGETT